MSQKLSTSTPNVSIVKGDDGKTTLSVVDDASQGQQVIAEVPLGTGNGVTIYTVPSGKTFVGTVHIQAVIASANGSFGLSGATALSGGGVVKVAQTQPGSIEATIDVTAAATTAIATTATNATGRARLVGYLR